ncbi:ImmA/IrrE family metallo-endopeptidase [Macrococcoides canis]|uniref:ImmA/IrrE family metallo-endopeptidase n=1 Tax=Macrococcoides canis TaxID=1855823 RepID=UPI00165DC73F|nr:ImmA/IrrE family metallo-endopeptidase [Macrococcus canis]QNR07756.1 ImmA/IrrE family metallo-endopeptidase [Macrococcus canis]
MRIEELVNDITAYIIERVEDLSIESLAYIYNIHIAYNHEMSCYMKIDGCDVIFIKFGTPQDMWFRFAHELGHYFMHVGNSKHLHPSYSYMQETEADKFALLFMMPERLIVEYNLFTVEAIMDYFKVSQEHATKRVELLINRSKTHKLIGLERI